MISASRAGDRLKPSSRFRISFLKSGMLKSRDQIDGFDELAPSLPLRLENLSARAREPIVTAAPLTGLFHPAAADPSAFFEAIKQRIKRSHVETQRAARTHFDELPEL